MGVGGGLTIKSMKRIQKIVDENNTARQLLYLLCQEDREGGKLLDAIEDIGLIRARIEHLYNAVRRKDTVFVNYVYLIQKYCTKEQIQKARYFDEYMDLVKKLEVAYIREYNISPKS